MRKTIAIDIDETIASTCIAWVDWLEGVTGIQLETKPYNMTKCPYDISVFWKDALAYEGLTGKEFFGLKDMYDAVMSVEGSVEACERLSEMGCRLLPVSKVYTEHTCSKRKWLKKHFPMLDSPIFISMDGRKSDVRCDMIVDDRYDNLKGFTKPTQGVILRTPYLERCEVDINTVTVSNWKEIITIVEMLEEL